MPLDAQGTLRINFPNLLYLKLASAQGVPAEGRKPRAFRRRKARLSISGNFIGRRTRDRTGRNKNRRLLCRRCGKRRKRHAANLFETLCLWALWGEETVDFARLGEAGVFLVTGDTGAGKSSILTPSPLPVRQCERREGKRAARTLRSDFAAGDAPTYVEFCFSHRGKRYTLRRSPEYLRPNKKQKDKWVTQPHEASLVEQPGGQSWTARRRWRPGYRSCWGWTRRSFCRRR